MRLWLSSAPQILHPPSPSSSISHLISPTQTVLKPSRTELHMPCTRSIMTIKRPRKSSKSICSHLRSH
uniref:Uncharacterized protein n=1 Tax=Fusarium oxysporum (strain Fo5176) TaxID=660025 RepID=A0A0D2XMS5_FUSOF